MSGTFKFGSFDVKVLEAFCTTRHSLGLVNFKPVVPGHVLVISRRVVPRFADLTEEEVTDLFGLVQRVGRVIEREYHGESLTITLQDGPQAGQSVPHVHVHVMPRNSGDWKCNDDIYPEIDSKEAALRSKLEQPAAAEHTKTAAVDNDARPARTEEDMAAEATKLRAFFSSYDDIWS